MTVYYNADFVSLDEHNTTFSIMVEDKGKIVYMGYNTPLCYREAKHIDLEGATVVPAVNKIIDIDAKGAVCSTLCEGENADFAILDKNILKEQNAKVLKTFVKGKDVQKSFLSIFG